MNPIVTETYNRRVEELDRQCKEIIADKRPVYTTDNADVVRNFRMAAMLQGTTPGQVLATYLVKQIISVVGLLTNPLLTDAEQETRFADARNYIDIGYVLWKEGVAHEKE